jgi:hypothetical protein
LERKQQPYLSASTRKKKTSSREMVRTMGVNSIKSTTIDPMGLQDASKGNRKGRVLTANSAILSPNEASLAEKDLPHSNEAQRRLSPTSTWLRSAKISWRLRGGPIPLSQRS